MHTADLEKLAFELAAVAVRQPTTKQAKLDPEQLKLLGQVAGMGVGGVGLGALLGLSSKKDRLKKMLAYGTAGGLAGAGLGALNHFANVPPEIPKPNAFNPLNWRWFGGPGGVARM